MRCLLPLMACAAVIACSPETRSPIETEPRSTVAGPVSMSVDAELAADATKAFENDPHIAFAGHYAAAAAISGNCTGFTIFDEQTTAAIAVNERGLRRNQTLAFLYYGETDRLMALAGAALRARNVDPENTSAICAFGKRIAGKRDDPIGRLLGSN